MGIIGVVAALTLPNLNSSTGDKEKVAKVKKIYSNLNDALGRAQAVYGSYENWFANDSDYEQISKRAGGRIIEFMKISKDCGANDNKTACFNGNYEIYRNGNKSDYLEDGACYGNGKPYKVILADGTALLIIAMKDSCKFIVDIDGSIKGKSMSGLDLFYFNYDKENGLYPSGMKDTDSQIQNGCLKSTAFGASCTAWVIQNENMDYLKADSSGKCPNGTVLSWSNTTCK